MANQSVSSVVYLDEIKNKEEYFQNILEKKAINGVKVFINSNEGVYLGNSPKQKRQVKTTERVKLEDTFAYEVSPSGYLKAEFLSKNFIPALDLLKKLPYNYSMEFDGISKRFVVSNYLDEEMGASGVKSIFLYNDLESMGYSTRNGFMYKQYPGVDNLEVTISRSMVDDFKYVLSSIQKYGTKGLTDVFVLSGSVCVGARVPDKLDAKRYRLLLREILNVQSKTGSFFKPIKQGVFEISKIALDRFEYRARVARLLNIGQGSIVLHWDSFNNRWLMLVDQARFYENLEAFVYFFDDTRCKVIEKI